MSPSDAVKVHFKLPDGVSDTMLPIAVRQYSTKIAGKGVIGGEFLLAPGKYVASVDLPDGSIVVEPIEVQLSDQRQIIELTAVAPSLSEAEDRHGGLLQDYFDLAPHHDESFTSKGILPATHGNKFETEFEAAAHSRQQSISRQWAPRSGQDALIKAGFKASRLKLNMDGQFVKGDPIAISPLSADRGTIYIEGKKEPGQFVLITPEGSPGDHESIAVAIPASGRFDAVEFTISSTPYLRAIPVLANSRANVTLSYLTEQSYSKVETHVGNDPEVEFRQLLQQKVADPIAAAVGGYGLLALNSYKPLEAWSRNLTNVAPWLPDGFAIHGETLARLGKHDQASRYFLSLCKLGIPVFSAGLSFAVDRIGTYHHHKLPDADAQSELSRWLKMVKTLIMPKLRVCEVLTTLINPDLVRIE